MDLLRDLALGFDVALSWDNLFYCFVGTLVGTLVGVLPGTGAARHARDAAADHLLAAAGRRPDHVGGHLLRRAVWRLDQRDPGQRSGRVLLVRHDARRLSDGAARQ